MSFLNTGVGSFGATETHPVYEGYNFEDGAAAIITMESYDDAESVIEAISNLDILILQESDQSVLEAGAGTVMERVKMAFKKLWGKIKAFFATMMQYFDAMTKSAAEFAKKYEKDLTTKSLSDFKYKMFNYTIPEAPDKNAHAAEGILKSVEEIITSYTATSQGEGMKERLTAIKEKREEQEEEIRAKVLGEGSKLDAEEFRKGLFAKYRGGADSPADKEEIPVSIHNIIAAVKASPKLKRAVEASSKQTDDTFNKYLKNLTAAQKKVEIKDANGNNNGEALAVLSGLVGQYQRIVTFQKTTITQMYSAWVGAIKERDNAYKSAMMAAFRHKDGM